MLPVKNWDRWLQMSQNLKRDGQPSASRGRLAKFKAGVSKTFELIVWGKPILNTTSGISMARPRLQLRTTSPLYQIVVLKPKSKYITPSPI
jgi:hypothetical protein